MIQRTKGMRNGERRPVEGAVLISWVSRSGETLTARAKCADVSAAGAKVICELPIDVRTNVFVQAAAHGLMGNASVRYCRRTGAKHIIGLLFSTQAAEAELGRRRLVKAAAGAEN